MSFSCFDIDSVFDSQQRFTRWTLVDLIPVHKLFDNIRVELAWYRL